MPIIEIESKDTKTRKVVSKRTAEVFFAKEQSALLFKSSSKFPDKVSVTVAFDYVENTVRDTPALEIGKYAVSDDAFVVDRFNKVGLDLSPSTLVFKQ